MIIFTDKHPNYSSTFKEKGPSQDTLKLRKSTLTALAEDAAGPVQSDYGTNDVRW